MSLPGFTFNITGASGATGLLGPKNSYRCYVFPRGGYAAQDSTGAKITFDSASVASRFAVGNWIQSGLLTTNIRQVGAVGGNSLTISGAALTVTTNDRIYLIGNTEPTVNGGSATYTTPNTIVRQRDDDAATVYANSMLTTNTDGMVQGFAVTALYDLIIQDGNRANQGSLIDLPVGVPEGISVSDAAIFGATVTLLGNITGISSSGVAVFGATVTMNANAGVTGSLAVGQSFTARNIWSIRYASAYVSGSSTGGIQEAINDLPATGGLIILSGGTTYSTSARIIPRSDNHFIGCGIDSTIVIGAAGTTHSIFEASTISRISFRNMTISGNSTARTSGSGISLTGTTDVRVQDCAFRDCNLSGVRLENSVTNRTWVINNYFTRCNTNNSSGDACVQGHGNPASHSNVWIEGNHCEAYLDAGIRMDTGFHVWIRDNRVIGPLGAGEEGIVVGHGTQILVQGNETHNNNGSGILYGTGVLTTSRDIRILDNICYDNNNGIKIDFQASTTSIFGLQVNGNRCYQNAQTQNYGILLAVTGALTGLSLSNAIATGNMLGGNGTGGFGTTGTSASNLLTCLLRVNNIPEESIRQVIVGTTDTILANSLRVDLAVTAVANPIMASAPTIANGYDGQLLEITNTDDSGDTFTLQDQGTLASSNLRLVGTSITLGLRDTVTLRYNARIGDWVQITPVCNVT